MSLLESSSLLHAYSRVAQSFVSHEVLHLRSSTINHCFPQFITAFTKVNMIDVRNDNAAAKKMRDHMVV